MTTVAKRTTKSVPAYTQIEEQLRGKIRRGEWSSGAMLPSRRDLAKEYGVSSLTIDRAVTRLIAEGLLRADDRRGTFVTQAPETASTRVDAQLDVSAATWAVVSDVRPSSAGAVRTPTIGIVATVHLSRSDHVELNNFWVRLILQSVEHAFSEVGRTTHFCNRVLESGKPLLPLRDALLRLASEGVDAIAVVGLDIDPQEVDEGLSVLDGWNVPAVCVTLGELSRPVPHVFYENRSAGYQAAEHLIQRGCRELLFLAPFMSSWVKERLEGVQASASHSGLDASAVQVYPRRSSAWIQEEDPEGLGYAAARGAIEEGLLRSGVVCVNDGVAFGLLRAAAEAGLEPGSDFALISFDDHPDARTAGITSLRPPMEMLGRETARLVMRALQGETTDLQVRLRSHLIPRRSTRAATA